MKNIVIIDYLAGNCTNLKNAIKKVGYNSTISNNKEIIKDADILFFPGVGSAKVAMENLYKLDIKQLILDKINNKTPFMGICLGMQILFQYSEEGDTRCLEILNGRVVKYYSENIIVPQIGWNNVKQIKSYIWKNISDNSLFYFVNSYYPKPEDNISLGTTNYDNQFTSIVKKDNIIACQFHPEKSGEVGLELLKNFIIAS